MSEYAQTRRSSGSEQARQSSGRHSGAMSDVLNARPAVQQTAQLKSALNGSGGVAQLNGDGKKKEGLFSGLFSKYIYGPHSYDFTSMIKPGGSEEDKVALGKDMAYRPAPMAFHSATEEGQDTAMAGGLINTMFNPVESSVHNITKAPHVFHNYFGGEGGWVKRQALRDEEGVKVQTSGGGTGFFPQLNVLAGHMGFNTMNHKLRMNYDQEYANEHYQDVMEKTAIL